MRAVVMQLQGVEWRWDADARAGYVKLHDAHVDETVEVQDGLLYDIAADGRVVGVEIHTAGEYPDWLDLALVLKAMQNARTAGGDS